MGALVRDDRDGGQGGGHTWPWRLSCWDFLPEVTRGRGNRGPEETLQCPP